MANTSHKSNKGKRAHWARFILPQLLTHITGRQRYLPEELEWGTAVLTGNIFRAFEWLFFRAYGKNGVGDTIRAEASVAAWKDEDGVLHVERHFFTLEAAVAHAECVVRSYFAKAFEPRPEFGFMPQPVFLTLGILGLKLSLNGDLHGLIAPFIGMAIATDTSGTTHPSASTTATVGLTVTSSSNRVVWGGFTANKASIPAISSVTFAGSAMTASANSPKNLPTDTSVRPYLYYQLAAPSGANNLVVTFVSAPDEIALNAVSYSGATSVPQDVSTSGTGTTTTLSFTTTLDNSWLVGIQRDDASGDGTAGTATTKRSSVAGQCGFYDSGGAKSPAGSYSLVITHGSTEYAAIGMSMGANSTTNQTAAAIGGGVAAIVKVPGKVIASTGAGTAAVKKQLPKTFAAVGAGIAATTKQLSKTLAALGAGIAVVTASRAYLQSVAAVGAAIATTSTKMVWGQVSAATAAGTAAVSKQLSLLRTIAATAAGSATVTAVRGVLVAATAQASAAISTSLGKTIAAVGVAIAYVSTGSPWKRVPRSDNGDEWTRIPRP